jgi:glycosyltransferase involved in cell wall biosynthesis
MNEQPLRVLIVAEHASARFGGEASLPLHYYRVLRARGVPVWLITHARVRDELQKAYPDDNARIFYIEDTWLHLTLWRISHWIPARLDYITTGYVMRIVTQLAQRRIARDAISRFGVTVVHQPMPVSPKEPSLLHGLGVPVVIGPMNGGMNYPVAFRRQQSSLLNGVVRVGRAAASAMNWLMPGKRRAAALLVANQRTRDALPPGTCSNVITLVENGVDLSLWKQAAEHKSEDRDVARFVFLGRLVDWKAVDLLLTAFAAARTRARMSLLVIGDGAVAPSLKSLSNELDLTAQAEGEESKVFFAGWMPQAECARKLRDQHCLVLPSLMECGGAVVLEAMSLGLPVIATAWGGPTDYLDASCGVLVEPQSRDALINGLADAMVRLAESPELRAAMGQAGRDKVVREFDWETKVDRMVEVYRSVMPREVGAATREMARS